MKNFKLRYFSHEQKVYIGDFRQDKSWTQREDITSDFIAIMILYMLETNQKFSVLDNYGNKLTIEATLTNNKTNENQN